MNPFQSIHKTGFRLLKMIHAEDSIVIPMYMLDLVLSLGQVYIGLFLTAGLNTVRQPERLSSCCWRICSSDWRHG